MAAIMNDAHEDLNFGVCAITLQPLTEGPLHTLVYYELYFIRYHYCVNIAMPSTHRLYPETCKNPNLQILKPIL